MATLRDPVSSRKKGKLFAYPLVLLLIIILGLAIYIHLNPTSSTTSVSTTPVVSIASVSPTTSMTRTLAFDDFYITNISGCTYVNQTADQTFARYSVQIANRLNEPVHFVNASVSTAFILSNGTLPKRFFYPQVVGSPSFGQIIDLRIFFAIAGKGFGTAQVAYTQGFLYLQVGEMTQPAIIVLDLSPSSLNSTC